MNEKVQQASWKGYILSKGQSDRNGFSKKVFRIKLGYLAFHLNGSELSTCDKNWFISALFSIQVYGCANLA